MTLSEQEIRTAQAIVQIFETGRPEGHYGAVTLIEGDTGHLTYGKAQTTLSSGNLFLLIKSYVETPGAVYADRLEPYLSRLERRDTKLDTHDKLKDTLRLAGDDPVMRQVQDRFFDDVYWRPAVVSADYIGAKTALGAAIIYDSRIHGAWHHVRDATIAKHGTLKALGEKAWFAKYISFRRAWLAAHDNAVLHPTVYRMDAFKALIKDDRWTLTLPFDVRGQRLDRLSIGLEAAPPTDRASAETTPSPRILSLKDPYLVGEDVRAVQNALRAAGFRVRASGLFNKATKRQVKRFQNAKGLVADGIVGPATRSALGLAN